MPPLSAAPLVALEDVLEALNTTSGPTTTQDDKLVAALIAGASALVVGYLGRAIARADYVETRNGNGADAIATRAFPIVAVAGVAIDGDDVAPRAGSAGAGFAFDESFVYAFGRRFTRGTQNVVLRYTAGYATTPPAIARAVVDLAARKYRERDRIGKTSESLAGTTTSYDLSGLPADVRIALEPFRNVVPLIR